MRNLLWTAAILPLLMVSCKGEQAAESGTEYGFMTVGPENVTLTEAYSASVRGRQDIDIYPQISGTITEVRVSEGDRVRKGQVLFVIDQVPYKAALQTAVANVHAAEASVETARLSYGSKQLLYEKNVISEYDLLTARNTLAEAEATLEQNKAQETNARNSLSYTEVKSPADGVVGTLPYKVGALVSPSISSPLTTVSDNSVMYVYFSMSEKKLLSLIRQYGSLDNAIEQMPDVQLQLGDGSVYERSGRIESISGVLNSQTGSGQVRAVFSNQDRQLLSGGTGNVLIPHRMSGVIVIPQEATYEMQDRRYVYKVTDGKADAARITVTALDDGVSFVVTSGLSTGDEIVTTGVGMLNDGDVVKR